MQGLVFSLNTRYAAVSPLVEKGPPHRGVVREDISVVVRESIQQVLGSARTHLYELEAPLMEMGLSSLQLLELRHLLQERTAKELEPTCFFKWGTPAAIISHLSGNLELKRVAEKTPFLEDRESFAIEDEAGAAAGPSNQGGSIAIVGLGCHFPGDARGPDVFWKLLRNGQNAVAERPLSREQIGYPAESKASGVKFCGTRWFSRSHRSIRRRVLPDIAQGSGSIGSAASTAIRDRVGIVGERGAGAAESEGFFHRCLCRNDGPRLRGSDYRSR